MFLIRYHDPLRGHVTVELKPRPTEVDYPERRLFKTRTSKDGAVVIQRPLRDPRPRRWTWKGYRSYVPNYEAQWRLLESLEAKARWDAGHAETTVEIWENETAEGGFDRTTDRLQAPDLVQYTNLVFTRVKILQVDRKSRSGGGPVTYENSTVEFVIADDSYETY